MCPKFRIFTELFTEIHAMHPSRVFTGWLLSGLFFLFVSCALSAQQIQVRPEEAPAPVKRFAGVEITGPTEICEGSETMLKVDGEYQSYTWSTGEETRTIRVNKPGVYEVTVVTKGGCSLTTSITVRTRPCT